MTDQISVNRNCSRALWKSKDFIYRSLDTLSKHGFEFFINNSKACELKLIDRYPNSLQAMVRMLGNIRSILIFYYHAKLKNEQWYLLYELSKDLNIDYDKYTKISPPSDRIWADPHAIYRDNKYFIFIEEMLFSENKGFISVFDIDVNGDCSTPVKVIEENWHLSYPQLYEIQGTLYMLPESSGNRKITLYKCIDFPNKWERCIDLMSDIEAVDSSLVLHNEKWWLFTNIKNSDGASENDELYIFYSDELLSNNWTPHKLNPVISDVTRARCAGQIIDIEGELIRPSQNCSRNYGYGYNLNVIEELTESDYKETLKEKVIPNDKKMVGTHTFVRQHELTMIDAYRRINRSL